MDALDKLYSFKNQKYLTMAMTHSSYANEHRINRLNDNERLEFLGDAVLEVVCSEFLYLNFPEMPEGELSKFRAGLVCEQSLAECARKINLGEHILLGKGEEHCGGRDKDSLISDALEAFIGAVYLDGGMDNAKKFILENILNNIEQKQLFFDSKTVLQEYIQARHAEKLNYELVSSEGPEHSKIFNVRAMLGDNPIGHGSGKSKKGAEQAAAYDAINRLKARD
ncbi:ribonuclease III [Parasporobacterium paucivorans]|uniref:Ribonuclease 3 n=1 Tax=Parasporobacterium paucivorans DSM 15970 TaxID=1122934 RepID=A0A1M6F1R4_9FIRM|nr:ribonuclease III [Parasporobacterium paucivorans]SHI91610.1 ribonuclease-3 [Parasporobacterium paucivorans DSM 15970]